MKDANEAARVLGAKLDADWTHANAMFNRELDSALDSGERKTAAHHRRKLEETFDTLTGAWATSENPVLAYLPEGLTAEQARGLARLVASRRPAGLYLALLVRAKEVEGRS